MTCAQFLIRFFGAANALIFLGLAGAAEIAYSIQTVAGSNLVGDGGSALNAQLSDAQGLALDRTGAVYIADPGNHRVRKVTGAGLMQTLAGTGFPGFSGDGGPSTEATLTFPYGVAVDASGNVYIADLGNNRVRRVTPDGLISTVAGTGQAGSDGDFGLAASAQLNAPRNVAVDGAGNLYITEFAGHRVREVTPDGLIRTVVGTGSAGAFSYQGSAILAELAYPAGLALDSTGALYIADSGNLRILRVLNGAISTLSTPGFRLTLPTGLCSDGFNGLYIADSGSRRILHRSFDGAMAPVSTVVALVSARDVAYDGRGNLLIADGRRVRLLTGAGFLATLAGDGTFGYSGDGGAATLAALNGPDGLAVDASGSLYIADGGNHRVRKVALGAISTVAGNGTASPNEGLTPTSTPVIAPEGLFADPAGVIWISERFGNRVRRLTPGGPMATIAGNGAAGYNGDARAATTAQLQTPGQVALDPGGALYIADAGNHRIRKVSLTGVITTLAGTGKAGFSGDGGQAGSAQLNGPRGVAFDLAGNLYVADTNNNRIRKVTPGGLITTVVGEGELPLNLPRSVAVDSGGALYIADTENHRIVKRSASGELSVIAGIGRAGFGGDGGPAVAAALHSPAAIAFDTSGSLYVADLENNRVRKLTPIAEIAAPVTQAPAFLHAATLTEGPVAPGELLSIAGVGIGPTVGVTGGFGDGDHYPTLLAETQVLFDGRAAPLLDVQPNQIQVQVPYEIGEQAGTHIEVFRAGERKAETTLLVTRAAPGIFPGITNQDGSLNSPDNPAAPGSTITFFATGEGQTIPAGIDGKRSVEPPAQPVGDVFVRVGGYPANIPFAAEALGKVGTLQIKTDIPILVGSGAASLSLSVGLAVSPAGVTVYVR